MTEDPDHPTGELPPVSTDSGIRSRATDVAAYSAFYRRFLPTLTAFLMWQGARLIDATEIAQDTMVHAWHRWPTIEKPEAWTHTTAGRALVRRVASTTEYPVAEISERPALLRADLDIGEWEQRHDILAALAALPRRQRQVLIWTLNGYSPTEIAAVLRLKPEAVRSSLLKARRKIALQLNAGEQL